MNADDYITFMINASAEHGVINSKEYKVMMTPYSKLTTASLPYILQDLLNISNCPITASISNLDTLVFTCENEFSIIDINIKS